LSKQYLPYFAAILVLFLIVAPIVGAESKFQCIVPGGYQNVTVSDAKKMLERGNVFLLDVRVPAEYDAGHIEGATLIPLKNAFGSTLKDPDELLVAHMGELPKNKYTKILVYCKVGGRGATASQMLADADYKRVYNMQGGLTDWVKAKYPIVVQYDVWNNTQPKNPPK
jgi:rhodanese-related sulfurtransferase